MKTIDIGLIQNKYTDLIVYDETERCESGNYISLQGIESVNIIFTGPEVEHTKKYTFDNRQIGILNSYDKFTPVNCSDYLQQKSLTLNVNGVTITATFEDNYTDADSMVNALNIKFASLDIIFNNYDEYIVGKTTTSGADVYINVVGGSLLEYLKFNIGIYRGNDINWGSPDLLQKDFKFKISVEDFGYINEIPETYWNIQYNVYFDNGGNGIYTADYVEFTYKQTEIYRAKIFEYISRNFNEFIDVEQRWQTDMEIFTQESIYFDSLYRAFKASLEIGNYQNAYKILNEIIEIKKLKPIL